MLRLINKNLCPPGGFKWRHEESGKQFSAWTATAIIASITNYLTANGYALPVDLGARVEDFTCQGQGPSVCEEQDHRKNWLAGMHMAFRVVLAGTKTLGSWALAGLPLVSQEKADDRSRVCAGCYLNRNIEGCAPCNYPALTSLVRSIIGDNRSEKHDVLLGCGACGCDLKTKVWTPLEHILKSFDYANLLPDHCWVKKEAA